MNCAVSAAAVAHAAALAFQYSTYSSREALPSSSRHCISPFPAYLHMSDDLAARHREQKLSNAAGRGPGVSEAAENHFQFILLMSARRRRKEGFTYEN